MAMKLKKIEIEKRDSWEQTPNYFPKPSEETSFVDLPDVPVASDDPIPLNKQKN